MKIGKTLLAVVLGGVLLTGCAGQGIDYNAASSSLQIGMSKEQVRHQLGSPRRTDVNAERERWIYWSPAVYGFTPVDSEVLAADRLVVTFREGGVTQWGNQTMQADALEMSSKIMSGVYSQQNQAQTRVAN
jgi:outer membrane protein assembly factor BamE (lipoprotein component of BamABCDE complex)